MVPRVLALAGVWFAVFYAVAGKGIGGDAQRLHGLACSMATHPQLTGRLTLATASSHCWRDNTAALTATMALFARCRSISQR